ncbi:uncharacterized protein BDR25DRAFT_257399 [Lindgomyces ingoldianus]|uniref:Uncharacterized protein n=1 Tax=Lindgomyces ingoldianus TaxID=673940 RepID=A0ACB6R1M2_9PLEO|nr:uncharacterized protein BDR25DRAFT_257399 [Lindgomyces ingoldianus]KAF2473178.1 hypothetical protein BDR25DRAFT_257399 [Lindgomyces ingoldianus]
MEQVPTPLRVGTPAAARRPSVEQVPSVLRVGSPVVDRVVSPISNRPPLMRHGTSGSDRLSQLFPSRPASAASPSPDLASSRRTSYPSPLLPAAEPAYRKPNAPAPPSFAENTAYDPTADRFSTPNSPPATQRSRTTGLLSRLASLKSGKSRGTYNRLDDEETGTLRKGKLKNVEEVDEPVGYDLSGFDGVPMRNFGNTTTISAADSIEQEHDANLAGYAAEYERLEAQLGAGMSSIVEVPFTHQVQLEPKVTGHKRALSNVEVVAQDAQKEAEKVGGIVAIADIPLDISDAFGDDNFETRSVLTTGHENSDGSKTSYYFPEDPDMPSWRPFSMGWPWISMLIIIALMLAAIQEFLCQLSMKRVREDPKGGLIQFTKPGDLSINSYFTWKYAPVLVFIIYGILWQISDFEVKRLEPFYQLSKKTGSTAAESLNMDYLTFMSWLVPLRALRHKQYAVIYSSLGTLVASSLVPVLQSASVNMWPPKKDRKDNELKSIRIDPPWSRAVTGCLLFVAICGAILLYEMRRKSGLLSDPKGIAGVAALATRSHILTDFHGLDTAPLDKIHKQLRHRRYILHKSSLWQGEYIRNSTERVREHGSDPRPLMLRLRAGVPYISFLILFTISIPIFMFVDGANLLTEKVPILLTALATIIKLLWGTMNCDIRMLEPFYILANRNAPPRTLTLDYTGTNPIFLPVKALLNRHYLVALVGIGSILTEILTVCVSSFSVDGKKFIPGQGRREHAEDEAKDRYNTDETFRSFWISFALVICILFVLVSIACLAYLRRSHKFMPRQIGTMASVLAFIHQSKMLVNFVDTEKFNSTQMTEYLEKQRKTYALGWFSGRDGDDHCGIDEEPILAPYKYGVDWTKTRVLGNQIGTWEHY